MFTNIFSILALYGLWVLVLINGQALLAIGQKGLGAMLGPRDDVGELTGAAGRLDRASANSVTALALFAPAVLLQATQPMVLDSALLAAQVFLAARILYPVIYVAGIPGLRTIVWTAGMLATVWLYVVAL
ncbi:Uncharacterized conserved protein, MAPEG superfamily [Loktanella fryxellensis]|uniref:Uncharacterized conserved protein, MAPEG superfamily n=1 Tax=Loktanella fryxellensis TaxID=245187 RepID=A0A1H8DJ60_9RHOB|nr:MAPEG family protein [Loktanella fryxellensis]SEN06568.1 Uncharacterized conserved protein, MAPEG superfamily [Loktanella fryxellensis]